MVFLPHTNTVILLEPYCSTMTEPGLPVVSVRQFTTRSFKVACYSTVVTIVPEKCQINGSKRNGHSCFFYIFYRNLSKNALRHIRTGTFRRLPRLKYL